MRELEQHLLDMGAGDPLLLDLADAEDALRPAASAASDLARTASSLS
jgi:hypothetical protein